MKRLLTTCMLLTLTTGLADALAVTLVKGPYLQNLTTDSVTVMWETDQPVAGRVEYGLGAKLDRKTPSLGDREIQEVRLTGLQPETAYQYRITVGDATAGPFAFRTAVKPTSPYRFAVYGDNRSHPDVHAKVAAAMAKHRPAFVINTGDLVSDGNKDGVWGPEFFTPLAELCHGVPIYPALGNHEGNGKNYIDLFSLPDPEWYYAFVFGNAKFFMIDSCYRKPNYFAPDSDQGQWLAGELKDGDFAWKFAVFHHPPYSSHPSRGGSLPHQKLLCPALEAGGVDVAFNGHNHNYERIFPMRSGQRDDAAGIHYVITGGGGAPLYPTLKEPFTAEAEVVHHFCIVDVAGPLMTLTAYAVDGHVIDRFGLCKDGSMLAKMAGGARDAVGAARADAVDRLSIIFSPKIPVLLSPFASDKDPAVRRAVAAGLGRLAMSSARPIALTLIDDRDAAVRRGAALAVARTSGATDADVIAKLLKDPDSAVRRSAAWFFVHVQGPDVLPLVVAALDDKDPDVRRFAIRGIKGVEGEALRPFLAKAILDDEDDVALPAVEAALEGKHVEHLIEPLQKACKSRHGSVRLAALKALVSTRTKAIAFPLLVEATGDPDGQVQGYAVGVLEKATKKDFGYDSAKWEKWWAEQPR
ncbi:MAG: HEAT repeat domain-containing protein [Phycisphaerae bacterium]|nr:HEAT repeat domain-containing protein [Phycisphaerae bacterium]